MDDFESLEELMSPINNWKNYQERLNSNRKANIPQLPHLGNSYSFLLASYGSISFTHSPTTSSFSHLFRVIVGLFLRDFTFLGENPAYESDNATISVETFRLIGKRVLFIEEMQSIPYKLPVQVSSTL